MEMNRDWESQRRTHYISTQAGGMNWNHACLRLFKRGSQLYWDPYKLDFSQDIEDWNTKMSDKLKYQTKMFLSPLIFGEECVTDDLIPLLDYMGRHNRTEEVIYLTQFDMEEAKHTVFMRQWLDAVGIKEDLTDNYLFKNEQGGPTVVQYLLAYEEKIRLEKLRTSDDPLDEALASTIYGQIVEGVGAELLFKLFYKTLGEHNLMPGFVEGMKGVNRDESRHIAFHTFVISRLIAIHGEDAIWKPIKKYMTEQLNFLITGAKEIILPFQKEFGEFENITFNELLNIVTLDFSRRVNRLQKAVGKSPDEVTFKMVNVKEAWQEAAVAGEEAQMVGDAAD